MMKTRRPLSSKVRCSKLNSQKNSQKISQKISQKNSQKNSQKISHKKSKVKSKVKIRRNRVKRRLNCQKLPKLQTLTRSLTMIRARKSPIHRYLMESLAFDWEKSKMPKRMLRRAPTM